LIAMIVPNPDFVKTWAEKAGKAFNYKENITDADLIKVMQE